MIHINLNMIFYTHVEHSPTKTIYIQYYTEKQANTRTTHTHTTTTTTTTTKTQNTHTHTHTDTHAHTHARTHDNDCSSNWVLILVGMKIL